MLRWKKHLIKYGLIAISLLYHVYIRFVSLSTRVPKECMVIFVHIAQLNNCFRYVKHVIVNISRNMSTSQVHYKALSTRVGYTLGLCIRQAFKDNLGNKYFRRRKTYKKYDYIIVRYIPWICDSNKGMLWAYLFT